MDNPLDHVRRAAVDALRNACRACQAGEMPSEEGQAIVQLYMDIARAHAEVGEARRRRAAKALQVDMTNVVPADTLAARQRLRAAMQPLLIGVDHGNDAS